MGATKIVSSVNCKLDLNAIFADNGAGSSPAFLLVQVFEHKLFVTGVTKTSKAELLLFLSSEAAQSLSRSETDPFNHLIIENRPRYQHRQY